VQAEVASSEFSEHPQRVAVHLEMQPTGKVARIRVESHDERLGWYSAGALTLPLHQLPLLEQAIAEMRAIPAEPEFATIIPFPGCDQAA
jgi:hypothetical protein